MIRILLTEVTPGAAEGVRAMLAALEQIEIVGYPRDAVEAAQMAVQMRPDILLIHDRLPGMSGSQACELVSLAAPEVACVLMAPNTDSATVSRAMRCGVRAVIAPSTSREDLAATLHSLGALRERKLSREFKLATDPAFMPVTVALVSARDGVGKTTVATNLATALGRKFPDQVVLLELCGQFGAAGLLLNLNGRETVMELAGLAPELDAELVEGFVVKHPSGIGVLMGGVRLNPIWTDVLSVEFIAQLLGLLRRKYRFVVCDLPPAAWPGGLYAISRAQYCLALAALWEVSSVRDAAFLLDGLVPTHVPDERVRLVVNRVSSYDRYTEEQLTTGTGRAVWHTLPYDTASIVAAANEAEPITTAKPTSAFAKGVFALADKLLADLEAGTKG